MKTRWVILIVVFILVLLVAGGGIHEHDFQLKANNKLKENIDVYFKTKEETVTNVSSIDYSLGQLEAGVETNKNVYYVVAVDTTPLICRYTILNFFTEPSVKIREVIEN